MELQARGNQEIAQKEMVSRFVHDVADMEVRAFTLKESAEQIRKDLQRKQQELERRYERKQMDRKSMETKCSEIQNQIREFKLGDVWAGEAGMGMALLGTIFFINSIILGIIGGLLLLLIKNEDVMIYFCIVFVFLDIIGSIIFFVRIMKNDYLIEKGKLQQNYQSQKDQIAHCDAELLALQTESREFVKKNIEFRAIADGLDRDSAMMEEKIQKCYALGIIKPAYQNLVSVLILDEIFSNDKADTMREAMLLCDTEIRHAELIGKLDQVMHALKTLSSILLSMNQVLEGISTNVSLISQDVYKMSEGQDRIAYATESLQKSAENTDFYITQKRMGML